MAKYERLENMATDGNSTAELDAGERAYDGAQVEQSYQEYQGRAQAMGLQAALGSIRPYSPPSTLELPLSQVSTGKTNKAGQPSRMKTWVTAELARVVAKAQQQGAVRVSITITPIFE